MKKLGFGAAALLISALFFTACDGDGWGIFDNGKRIVGKGALEKFDRDAKDFKGIEVSSSANVYVRQAAAYKVVIEAQKNIADVFETVVEGGILKLKFKSGSWNMQFDKLNVYVETPSVSSLSISGSGDVTVETPFEGDDLSISVSGSGNVKADKTLTFKKLETQISGSGDMNLSDVASDDVSSKVTGSGNIELKGKAQTAHFTVAGSGDLEAKNLIAKSVVASVGGSGNITCHADEAIDANAGGSGEIKYSGNATSVKSHAGGSGAVTKEN